MLTAESDLQPLFVQPRSLPDLAYEHLRQAILSRRLPAGAPRQEKIAAELQISRLPVREALRRLHVEGLIGLQPRRGYSVASLNRDEIEELFDIRALLEERAGYFAALRRNENDISELAAILAELEKTCSQQPVNVARFGQQNQAFHARLLSCSGRKQLCQITQMTSNKIEPYIRMSASLTSLVNAQRDHREIFAAFRNGNAELLSALCRHHCDAICKQLLDCLEFDEAAPGASQ